MKESAALKQLLSATAKAGEPGTIRVKFPETTVTEAGAKLTIPQSKETPTLSIATSLAKPGAKYLLLSLDLDAPFPSLSFMSPILHGLHTDLTPSATADADGFAPLEGATKWVVPYIGPGPPKPSAPHRYMFIAFEQPDGLDAAKIRSLFGWGEDVGVTARVRWDQQAFVAKTGLGPVVASSFFLCGA